ncbi:hypothetical protein V6N13_065794 [Hibiscus sabdariffa]|uniref:Uncharacterized protein n=1 Tax=Hibiscus sabdariffa TaxID=183260 RepID=A0ABR2QQ60_9ROSI
MMFIFFSSKVILPTDILAAMVEDRCLNQWPNSLCDHDNRGGNAAPILQRCCQTARCHFVLFVVDMDMVKRLGHALLDYIDSCSGWVHCYNA